MKASLLVLFALLSGAAAGQECGISKGRAYYADGQYRQAAAQFESALRDSPDDAALHYWAGMSYQVMADIGAPLDHRYRALALRHLTRAAELAPGDSEYRGELFHFLLDSGHWREAATILRNIDASDPERPSMEREFTRERHANSSAEARVSGVFLAVPRAAYRIAQVPLR